MRTSEEKGNNRYRFNTQKSAIKGHRVVIIGVTCPIFTQRYDVRRSGT